jgi:hypothetical protein
MVDLTDAVPGGTFRENLLREPGQKTMTVDHPGHQFIYENLKKQEGVIDANGDIHINRRDTPEKMEEVKTAVVETAKAVEGLKVNGDLGAVNA